MRPSEWAGITVVTAVVAFVALRPRLCAGDEECARSDMAFGDMLSSCAIVALCTALFTELAALRLTWVSARPLMGMLRGIEYTFLPPTLLCVALGALVVENALIGQRMLVHVAVPGVGKVDGFPVFTSIYLEWLVNVPILLVLAGHCAMSRPLEEISRPLVVTNVYMILSWVAYFVVAPAWRWTLIALCFLLYGWASLDMVMWVRNFRENLDPDLPAWRLRVALTFGLIAMFFVYGMIYLAAMGGGITSRSELTAFLILNFGVKLAFLFAFVGIRSSQFYELLVNLLINKSTSFERQIAVDTDFGQHEPESTLHVIA